MSKRSEILYITLLRFLFLFFFLSSRRWTPKRERQIGGRKWGYSYNIAPSSKALSPPSPSRTTAPTINGQTVKKAFEFLASVTFSLVVHLPSSFAPFFPFSPGMELGEAIATRSRKSIRRRLSIEVIQSDESRGLDSGCLTMMFPVFDAL